MITVQYNQGFIGVNVHSSIMLFRSSSVIATLCGTLSARSAGVSGAPSDVADSFSSSVWGIVVRRRLRETQIDAAPTFRVTTTLRFSAFATNERRRRGMIDVKAGLLKK